MISSCRQGSKKGLVIIGRLESQQPHRKDLETVACERSSTGHHRPSHVTNYGLRSVNTWREDIQ
jgi:hypothetical protein